MIYVVLGMHKSGTTLVAQTLHHSGINMGGAEIDSRIGYDKGNQYERHSTWRLNEDILGCKGLLSIDITAPEQLRMTAGQRLKMQDLIADLDRQYTDWGFKDPRTCLTYPLWAEELPEHKIIAIYRSVDELWQRYRASMPRRYPDFWYAQKLVRRWNEHNLGIYAALNSGAAEYLLLEYADLMKSDGGFRQFEVFVGRKLVDRRRTDLYRHRQAARSVPLELAKWTVKKATGQDPQTITEQLMGLRDQKIYV